MVREIALNQGFVALVDDADFPRVSQFNWFVCKRKNGLAYAWRNIGGRGKGVHLHRFIVDAPKGVMVDHKDRNGLNCQRANIRVCTNSQNQANAIKHCNNTSGFKGVYFFKQYGSWRSRIMINGKRTHLGYFDTPEEAALAYDIAARKHHGDFSRLNFPNDGELAA